MGVPKFFRYISERYPCLSEVVKEYQIPEFDNLYLDMNGIIHMCSHPDDADPHFRISEEKIFMDIFHYIEVLFRMIKPIKLFFMAVDGVAPRAKMNQQRGRRFRSAKEALTLEAKAIERGESLPTSARFDSNCITPGTIFMDRLHEQLKYFVVHKISSDKLWKKCKVILSGQETPGEGEHKIMDYIRYMRAQPGYDPNTRHCLYGLDADLIMLGLCTHEPHFCLLREEVRFGKKSNKRKNIPEQITFYLLHLSLMREYLELEFLPLKDTLTFEYDMEKIIDDWVLMGFLVGNDFIPHLPNMHIDNGALTILYNTYMKVLPKLGGYINEDGVLNLKRFEVFIQELSNIDITNFTERYADLKWFEAKRTFEKKTEEANKNSTEDLIDLGKPTDSGLADLIKATDDILLNKSCDKINLDNDSELENDTESDSEDNLFQAEFIQHKTDYYMNKLEYETVTENVLKSQAKEYVRAIQWNLHYYYNGVCSWSWYYPHHYAPYISDIKEFSGLTFDFELGHPFKPYEQLLGVLPTASKSLLPEPYQLLMTMDDSPIKMYYPEDFKTDLNGKKQDWEAVVLIPFIEEEVLLKAMETCNQQLTDEEVKRNTHGPMLVYHYTPENLKVYESPQYFPNIMESHAVCDSVSIDKLQVPINQLVKGKFPGAKFDVYYPGFPTMKHLDYTGSLKKAKVKVFEQPSRGENMILHIIEDDDVPTADMIAKELLGKTVHVGWPHLVEALVVTVSTKEYRYYGTGDVGQYNVTENKGNLSTLWDNEKYACIEHYQNRLGVDVGPTSILVQVKVMTGRKYIYNNDQRITLEKQWADITSVYPLQTIVNNLKVHEEKYASFKDAHDVFPIGSHCFMLGQPCYGALGEVLDSKETIKNGRIKLSMKKFEEPDLNSVIELDNEISVCYMNIHVASTRIAISKKLLGRITGSVYLIPQNANKMDASEVHKANIGLNLKYNKKNEEIPGYTRKEGNTWYYSEKAIELVLSYMKEFPIVFEYLNFHDGKDIYHENEMFPEGDPKECIRQITSWIKKQPFNLIERQVCGGSVVEPEAVQCLEKVVDCFNKKNKNTKPKQVVVQVKPHLLYKHSLQMGNLMPDPTATFELYDRVVNVREGYTVPMGYKGTIIGIHKSSSQKECETTFDALFDEPFPGALSVNSSSNRCYQMPKLALINISHGIRVLEKKSGKPGLLQNMQNKMSRNTYGNGNMHYQQPQFQQQPRFTNWSQSGNFTTRSSSQAMIQNYPPYNPNPNFNGSPNFPITPFQSYNNTANYQSSGPNSFVPYKSNHFALNPIGYPINQPRSMESKMRETNLIPTQVFKPSPKNNSSSNNVNQLETSRNFAEQNKRKNENMLVLTPEDVFAHARANQHNTTKRLNTQDEKLDNETNILFHTARLLKEFQIRDLGCPSYQYFTAPHGLFVASIVMPDGAVLMGEHASTKDEAAENTALVALRFLNKDEKQDTKLPIMSPQMVPPKPPKTWQNPQGSPQKHWTKNKEKDFHENWRIEKGRTENWRDVQNRTKVNTSVIHKHLNLNNSTETDKKKLNPASIDASFIPLQAVRPPRSRTNSSNASETVLGESKTMNYSQSKKSEDKVPVSQFVDKATNAQQKPKRERKVRIAANFKIAMNN